KVFSPLTADLHVHASGSSSSVPASSRSIGLNKNSMVWRPAKWGARKSYSPSSKPSARWQSLVRQFTRIVEQLPANQRQREIAVFPDKIVKGAKAETVALNSSRISQQAHDLKLSNLV